MQRNGSSEGTLALFDTILKKAEAEAAGDQSGQGRAKLFHIVTKLIKLNLQDEEVHSQENSAALWAIILDFLERYPDYALYRPAVDATSAAAGQQQQKTSNGQGSSDVSEADPFTGEMLAWLLPRMIRRIAVIQAEDLARGQQTLAEVAAESSPSQWNATFTGKSEKWLADTLSRFATHFYHREEGGLAKRRQLMQTLLTLHQDASQLQKIETLPTVLRISFHSGSLAAQDGRASPFQVSLDVPHIKVQTYLQVEALKMSIIRVMISALNRSEQWLSSFVPDVLEAAIGNVEDWQLEKTVVRSRELEQQACLSQRLRNAERIFTASDSLTRNHRASDQLLAQCVVNSFLTYLSSMPDGDESLNRPLDFPQNLLSEALVSNFLRFLLAVRDRSKQESLLVDLSYDEVSLLNGWITGVIGTDTNEAVVDDSIDRTQPNAITLCCLVLLSTPPTTARLVDGKSVGGGLPSVTRFAQVKNCCETYADVKRSRKDVVKNLGLDEKQDQSLSNAIAYLYTELQCATRDHGKKRRVEESDTTLSILGPSGDSYASAFTIAPGKVAQWEEHFRSFCESGHVPNEMQLQAVAAKLCPQQRSDDVSGQHCLGCSGELIMGVEHSESPRQHAIDTDVDVVGILMEVRPRLSEDASVQMAFWHATICAAVHRGQPYSELYQNLPACLHGMRHKHRLVRLAAGRAANALLSDAYRQDATLVPEGTLSQYFAGLEGIIQDKSAAIRQTGATTAIGLARIANGALLGKALSLIVLALARRSQLRAIIMTQLDGLCKARDTAAYKLFSPFLNLLCPIIARNLDATFSLLHTFTDTLRTPFPAFLRTPSIARIFLAEAVSAQRDDLIQLVAECSEINAAELLVLNVDCCFAPLYWQDSIKFRECQAFFMRVLQSHRFTTSYQKLVQGNLPALLLEVLVLATSASLGRLDTIIVNIFSEVRGAPTTMADANKMLGSSSTVLAVFGRAGDSLRGMYGKKSKFERDQLLQAMDLLIARIGHQVSGAAPQIMTILQTSFKDREIRLETLRLWKRFIQTLSIQEVKPLLAQTSSVLIQAWPDLETPERCVVKAILRYLLVEKNTALGDALTTVADMSGIAMLEECQARLDAKRKDRTVDEHIHALLSRLDTVNEATLVQTLHELIHYLKTQTSALHRMAAGTSFSPLLGELVHGLLQTAIRSTETKTQARGLAFQCLSVLGALDPDRMTYPAEETPFIVEHDLRDADECIRFALYTIEKILLRVLRTTTDPQQQSALYLAIQGLAAVCGFDSKLRRNNAFQPGVDASIRQRWNTLSRPVQDVVEPLISTSIQVENIVSSETPTYPLYAQSSSYREWLQKWTSDLIDHLVKGNSGVLTSYSAAKLFGPLRAAVRRGHDLTVPHYILPFLVFYVVTSGNVIQVHNIRKEIEVVLQDQITPSLLYSMPVESRPLCAQVVFELMDHLNTWKRARVLFVARKYKRKSSAEMDDALKLTKKIDEMFRALPQNIVADAAFKTKSYARALQNYERILYNNGARPVTEQQTQYENLHHIYAELNEPDGMEGVSVSILSPSIQHQIREHEMTGRWTSAQSCWEVQLQLEPHNPASHLGLLRCLTRLGHYDSLRTHIAGLQINHPDWHHVLSPYTLQSALISGSPADISAALEGADPTCDEAAFARIILALGDRSQHDFSNAMLEAAESLGTRITTASQDSYYRFYDSIVNLHMLYEIESLFLHNGARGAAHRRLAAADQANFSERLQMTAPTFSTRETILNMRRNIYKTLGSSDVAGEIGPLWLTTSKIAIKAKHLQTAYSAILQANQLKADFAFVESAKLHRANEQSHRALQEMEQGLKLLGVFETNSSTRPSYDSVMAQRLAKATLRSALWMQDSGRYENIDIQTRIVRSLKLCPEWETGYYRLGQYADDLLQALDSTDLSASSKAAEVATNTSRLANMDICVHNFSRALRFGTKYIYQALPRMITIWLDFGQWREISSLPPEAFQTGAAVSKDTKMRKLGQQIHALPKANQEAIVAFTKIYGHMRRAMEKLPSYMWLAVLPQLVSRINHDSMAVYQQLVHIIERVIQDYPQQAVWTMVSVLFSQKNQRRQRCSNILQRAQGANHKASAANREGLSVTIRTLQSMVEGFIEMSNLKVEGYGILSMTRNFPGLKALTPCDIIIPLQNAMTITLPTNNQVMAHKPFPSDLVTFQGFQDDVEIMQSVAKPRKIVINGSDGKTYRFLCKPVDDLRKDNRLMECTSLIGRLLMKDADARKRHLQIRTYAVIPLQETCGLIEWVPDTAGIRNILIKCYEPRGLVTWSDKIKKIYEGLKTAQKNDPVKCGQVFSTEVLPSLPPIFHEWFLNHFPEPTAWHKARTSYGRTAAVMSMVGFVLGLGDRHGENILIDTTNGDVVHVDFNCLFGMGQVFFDIVEKVPFRLTQNMVDGLGITGVEGVFRRSCEITLRILRENRNSLLSVLESFVHDPLLDLQLNRGKNVQRATVGAGRNESKEAKARREEAMRQEEARQALAAISHKLKGTQSSVNGPPSDRVSPVEMTVEALFREATDPKNLGGMYMGWGAWV